jgi:hypothetical protein
VALQAVGRQNGKVVWLCRCNCKNLLKVVSGALRSGNTSSCGDVDCCPRTKHGHTARGKTSPTWRSWSAMIDRCFNPNNHEYRRYGGSGITVCASWLGPQGFISFLADMGERPAGTSIDRFPNNAGHYAPGNCRWATPHEQNVNRKVTKLAHADVQEIHVRHERGETQASIAVHFNIAPCHVSLILSGSKWKGSKTDMTRMQK